MNLLLRVCVHLHYDYYSLLCHLPSMLEVIQVHQLVVLASIVVTCEITLHTTHDDITILGRVGIIITQLFKITPINLIIGNRN